VAGRRGGGKTTTLVMLIKAVTAERGNEFAPSKAHLPLPCQGSPTGTTAHIFDLLQTGIN
jgi:hypothetical protein